MGEKSAISWTNSTWNPVTGCSRVSPGCEHCYAESLSLRMGWSKKPWTAINAAENVVLHEDRLGLPLRWQKPRMIFANSMSDLFHEQVPDAFIDKVFGVMGLATGHTFQVLTKRPERMREYLGNDMRAAVVEEAADMVFCKLAGCGTFLPQWPLPNVWIGTSIEDQRRADERIPHMLDIHWPVRFLSCEPLLGPVDLTKVEPLRWHKSYDPEDPKVYINALTGHVAGPDDMLPGRINWVIDGGESGPGFRPADTDWYRAIRDACVAAGVPYFHKQGSAFKSGQDTLLDGAEWHQFPEVR